jgi:hypothetical protein
MDSVRGYIGLNAFVVWVVMGNAYGTRGGRCNDFFWFGKVDVVKSGR